MSGIVSMGTVASLSGAMIILFCWNTVGNAETIYLKDGRKVEAKITQRSKNSVTIDWYGVPLTYWFDEIDHIEDEESFGQLGRASHEQTQPFSSSAKPQMEERTAPSSLGTRLGVVGGAAINEEDAAPRYRHAGLLLTPLPDDFQNRFSRILNHGWSTEDESLKALLTSNEMAITEFKKATQLSKCRFSTGIFLKKDATAEVPKYVNEINVAKLLLLQGRLLEREKKLVEGVENYLSVLKFTSHLGQQEDLILYSKLLALVVRKLACTPLKQNAMWDPLDLSARRNLLDTLVTLRGRETDLENALREEKETLKNTIRTLGDQVERKGLREAAFMQAVYQEVDTLEDNLSASLATAFRENRVERYEEQMNQLQKELEKEQSTASNPMTIENVLGSPGIGSPMLAARMLVTLGTPQWRTVATKYYTSLAEFDTLVLGVAIKTYELERGRTPNDLGELIPAYLSKIPPDPFNNFQPLKYEKRERGWTVYSVGPDKVDNHGSLGSEESDPGASGDILFPSS